MAAVSILSPGGYPKSPDGSFSGKTPGPVNQNMFTVSGSGVSLVFTEFFTDVVLTDAPVTKRTN
jgi:hypothetical protein